MRGTVVQTAPCGERQSCFQPRFLDQSPVAVFQFLTDLCHGETGFYPRLHPLAGRAVTFGGSAEILKTSKIRSHQPGWAY